MKQKDVKLVFPLATINVGQVSICYLDIVSIISQASLKNGCCKDLFTIFDIRDN